MSASADFSASIGGNRYDYSLQQQTFDGKGCDVTQWQFPLASSSDSSAAVFQKNDSSPRGNDDIVWVTKRYDPTDPRFTVPVLRYKYASKDHQSEACRNSAPLPTADTSDGSAPRDWVRNDVETDIYASQAHTRCEQWSTLREMLPSRGRVERVTSSNWGSGCCEIPSMKSDRATRFPYVRSEMTRFCDTAHQHDPMFRLH